ncbi:NUDIX domain-containing protein [Paenibacillus piri]|uniref:NUDIX domain-containing protein n=1 Tax=Paenibacillus piri TaxID=2547395 RepID=A0A4R5KGD2_9BACL|nr:NUDIX domain-containing protein [Paenibacillus piri]
MTVVLLLKRQNTGFEDGKWSVDAGRMDGGEEVKAAAIREAKEEAGVDIDLSDGEVLVKLFNPPHPICASKLSSLPKRSVRIQSLL